MPQIKHSWVWVVPIWTLARCARSCSNEYNPNSTVLYLGHLSTDWNNLFLKSWRCVVTRGRPLLGRSVNLPVALRRWTKRDIVDSCTPNCCAMSRCDRPCKIRALPLSSCDKRTISLNKLKQQTFSATDTNGTKVRFGNVLKWIRSTASARPPVLCLSSEHQNVLENIMYVSRFFNATRQLSHIKAAPIGNIRIFLKTLKCSWKQQNILRRAQRTVHWRHYFVAWLSFFWTVSVGVYIVRL